MSYLYFALRAPDQSRQVTKKYEFNVPLSVLAMAGRAKKHDVPCPGAKCQKKLRASNKHDGQCRKKTWTGQAHSSFFDILVSRLPPITAAAPGGGGTFKISPLLEAFKFISQGYPKEADEYKGHI